MYSPISYYSIIYGIFENLHSWVIPGISYLSREQEALALSRLNLAHDESNSASHLKESKESSLASSADILFWWRIKNRLNEWRDSLLRNTNGGFKFDENSKDLTTQFEIVFFKMRPSLKLKGFTSHQLRLIRLVMLFFLLLFLYPIFIDLFRSTTSVQSFGVQKTSVH